MACYCLDYKFAAFFDPLLVDEIILLRDPYIAVFPIIRTAVGGLDKATSLLVHENMLPGNTFFPMCIQKIPTKALNS